MKPHHADLRAILKGQLMPLLLLFLTLLFGQTTQADAQRWTTTLTRDNVYDAGRVAMPGNSMVIACAARSPKRGQVLGSQWWEVSVAPPWQYLFVFQDQLVPNAGSAQEVEMILFADQTGYRLPPVQRNELEGGWQTMLGMTDPMFASIATATRLVLQVGTSTAWQLPIEGLASGLKDIRDACGATWNATGIATPSGFTPPTGTQPTQAAEPAAGFTLPSQIQTFANQQCSGVATFEGSALKAGDLDGDGAPDIVLDWGFVRCNGQSMRPFCGAANCQYDVFMSSRGYAITDTRLAVGVEIVTHRSGRQGLRIGGTAQVCSQINCNVPWLWNGTSFVQVP